MITETQALYQTSHLLSDRVNNKLNKINFLLEIGLTLSIFASSFLILTIERDWWGGYLGSKRNSTEAMNFNEWL